MARKVLFLCTNNAARSQMAEALLRHFGDGKYQAYSAGMRATEIHPLTIQVMREIGIDVSDQRSKDIKEIMGRMSFDDAVIVCRKAEDDCPRISADAKRIHRWLFEDPVRAEGTDAEKLAYFRDIRDQISARVQLWLAENEEAERVS
ncbi:MAG: arsenate reductase ArsC [Chloroflexi bacterium]|nr:arsenate reductase ArsC [Chloroflexota bacterium]